MTVSGETTATIGSFPVHNSSSPGVKSKTPDARRLCTELLRGVSDSLYADSAVLYAPTGDDRVVLITSTGRWHSRGVGEELAKLAAVAALRSRDVVVMPEDIEGTACEAVAIPCRVDGEVAAVLVAQRLATTTRMRRVELEQPLLLALGLAVERYRVQLTLEEVRAEAEGVRRQLDAYAVDLRSTYFAERDRSEELNSALTELTLTYESTVRGLAIAVEAKDSYTGGHLYRVSRYGLAITAVVAPDHTDDPQFEYGFLLHDVGKLVVPDAVLMKEGPLDDEEWAMMRAHPEAGRTILDQIPFLSGANEIVHSHHERWDGAGYPRGLRAEEIPLGARIFPLADVFDAMTTTRPYRKAKSVDEAREELQRGSGTQFCPDAVEAFWEIPVEELELVRVGGRPDIQT